MKATTYMSSAHLLEFIKIAIASGEAKAIAEQTKKTAKTPQEKNWAKRLAIAATHLGKVVDERMACLDYEQAKTVDRRWKNSEVRLYTVDQMRVEDREKPEAEDRTISYDDWCKIGEMALLHCDLCPQGCYVETCEYRKAFHRIGLPVGREEVKDGQCEFRVDDYIHVLLPQGGERAEELIHEEVKRMCIKAEREKAIKNKENDQRLFL